MTVTTQRSRNKCFYDSPLVNFKYGAQQSAACFRFSLPVERVPVAMDTGVFAP